MKRALIIPLIAVVAVSVSVCVVAQQQNPRIIGLAVATVEPGHMSEYQDTVRDSILPFLTEQGVEVIGVFENFRGGPSNELTIMVAYRDMAHMQEVAENSTLTTIQRDTFEAVRVLNNKAMTPVAFSPMQ